MKLTTYLFDLDGTLIDTKIYAELYAQILKNVKHKLRLSDETLDAKAQQLGLKKNKYGRWDTGDLCRELGMLDMYYNELEKMIRVMPVLHDKVESIFEKLKQDGKRIGIVSNSMRRTINAYVHKYGLSKYVDFIFSSDDAGCKKEKPDYWDKLVGKEKLKPKDCVVVGDDLVEDVEVPKAKGFSALHVKSCKDLESVLKL